MSQPASSHSVFPLKLETPRLQLREFEKGDVDALNVFDRDPAVARYLTRDASDLESTRKYLTASIEEQRKTPRTIYDLAILLGGTHELIGRVGFRVGSDQDAAIWFVLRKDAWGNGYGPEAAGAMVSFAFSQLGLHRVWGDCDPRNTGSRRLMEKLGMRQEAHFIQNVFIKNEWCDTAIYAVLDREWRGR